MGVLFSSGTGRLVRVEGQLNGAKYRDILNENLFHSAQDLRLGEGSPSNMTMTLSTAKAIQEWLRDNSLDL